MHLHLLREDPLTFLAVWRGELTSRQVGKGWTFAYLPNKEDLPIEDLRKD
jgi:hypothetical protein